MTLRSSSFKIACFALLWLIVGLVPAAAGASDLLLILDASGSMWGQIGGQNKIVIARDVVGGLVDQLPDDQHVGLIAYGHRKEGDCQDIELVSPLAQLDRQGFKATVNALNPKGKTPITASVNQAFEVAKKSDRSSTIVLVSDGLETCGGDPCAAVRAAKEQGIDFVLHVVGFDVAKEDVSQLECAAQAGGGLFLTAENADELGQALDAAVAQPADLPAGGLSVKTMVAGNLHDATVMVTDAASGKAINGGRTYTRAETNPRKLALPAGTYDVRVRAVGLKGDIDRHFSVTLAEGEMVEKEFDFTSGELSVGATRNGQLSDATVAIFVTGTNRQVASGRTYKGAKTNPKSYHLTAGTYDIQLKAIEIGGDHRHRFEKIVIEPGGKAEVFQEYTSGTLKIGARRGDQLIDTTLRILSLERQASEGQSRTYTSASSNPKAFILLPGDYEVTLQEIKGERQKFTVTVVAGETVEKMIELPAKP